MAAGSAAHAADYHGRLTGYVMVVTLIAASGGLLFGGSLAHLGRVRVGAKQGSAGAPTGLALAARPPR